MQYRIALAGIATAAVAAGWGRPWSGPAEIVLLNGFFAAAFALAAWLFRVASLDGIPGEARTQRKANAVVPLTGSFEIRVLGPDDVVLMEALNDVFGEAFDSIPTYRDARPSSAYLRHLLGSACFIAVAALQDGEVIGGLGAYELKKFEQERSEIYIYDLAVCERHRRRGVATALIGEVQSIAESRGAWVVFVQADLGDDPAIALYEKLGRREDVVQFDIEARRTKPTR